MQQKHEVLKKEKNDDGIFYMDPRHEMQIEPLKLDPLYEKTFLSNEDKSKTEYAQNTTTWD